MLRSQQYTLLEDKEKELLIRALLLKNGLKQERQKGGKTIPMRSFLSLPERRQG